MSKWIEWTGGECPVDYCTLVDVRHRDGDVFFAEAAGFASAHDWDHDDVGGDIMAYRLHNPALLAAASELLEALELVVASNQLADDDVVIGTARAAIANAKGETPC